VESEAHHNKDEAHEHQRLLKVSEKKINQAARHQKQEHRLFYYTQGDCEYAAISIAAAH
jgi:hypothetical protein